MDLVSWRMDRHTVGSILVAGGMQQCSDCHNYTQQYTERAPSDCKPDLNFTGRIDCYPDLCCYAIWDTPGFPGCFDDADDHSIPTTIADSDL